jgi:UDP-glucose 4-epimerase
LRQFKNGEKFTIVPDGKQKRDFTWIEDVVRANICAMHSSEKEACDGSVFNIGYGKSYSVLDVACIIAGKKIKEGVDYEFIEPRIGEARKTLACNKKAYDVFGWVPAISLETGLDIFKTKIM